MFLVEFFFTHLKAPETPYFIDLLNKIIYNKPLKFDLFFALHWTFSINLPYFWEKFPCKTITLDKAISRTQIT